MRKRAKFTGVYALCYREMTCPFCGARTVENPTYPWCATCCVEYVVGPNGGISFDDQRKTPRFAFAKALNLSCGVRIGKP